LQSLSKYKRKCEELKGDLKRQQIQHKERLSAFEGRLEGSMRHVGRASLQQPQPTTAAPRDSGSIQGDSGNIRDDSGIIRRDSGNMELINLEEEELGAPNVVVTEEKPTLPPFTGQHTILYADGYFINIMLRLHMIRLIYSLLYACDMHIMYPTFYIPDTSYSHFWSL
jgi:hypothetical protein